MRPPASPVSVVIARFEDLVGAGLHALISQDPALRIVAEHVPLEALDDIIAAQRPQVTILNFGSLNAAADVHRLHSSHPGTRLLVLANRPSPAD